MQRKIGIYIFSVLSVLLLSCSRNPTKSNGCIHPLGELLLDKKQIKWGTIHLGQKYRDSIKIYNPTSQAITITTITDIPEIKIDTFRSDTSVPPQKYISIVFKLSALDSSLIGHYNQGVYLKTNDEILLTPIMMEADILENFTTSDTNFQPQIEIERDTFSFGTISPKTKASILIPIKNSGNKDLIIRKIENSCGCTSTTANRDVIPPKTSSTLHVIFDGSGKNGFQQKSVTLYSNDPQNPIRHIIIKGYIK